MADTITVPTPAAPETTCFLLEQKAPWSESWTPREAFVGPNAKERAMAKMAHLSKLPLFQNFDFDVKDVALNRGI